MYLMVSLTAWYGTVLVPSKKAFLTSFKSRFNLKDVFSSKIQFISWFKTVFQKFLPLLFQGGPSSRKLPNKCNTAV